MKLRIKVIIMCLILLIGCFALSGCGKKDPELVGAYSEDRAVNQHDMVIFNEALSEDEVAKYVPQHVATQVVSGTNYRFHCAVMDGSEETGDFVDIIIYDAIIEGNLPEVTEIIELPADN